MGTLIIFVLLLLFLLDRISKFCVLIQNIRNGMTSFVAALTNLGAELSNQIYCDGLIILGPVKIDQFWNWDLGDLRPG